MIKIGQYYFNPNNITWIIEREVYFNNGKSLILTEPEIQELFDVYVNEKTPLEKMIQETREDLDIKPKKKAKKCKTNCGDYACDTGCKK
jgi:hypothetical protein